MKYEVKNRIDNGFGEVRSVQKQKNKKIRVHFAQCENNE